ncbi:metalloregulator ArsR/SmtB family transcription factor [Acidimicrobiia bacterium EGI L10123]|uniref:metalloregulator ArsR/SmtB family transcription factor n=1 Tax=Salinilacustrithrix flava TaxID=2957203 RepID=UPI003D7C1643|nr:metalloregulator ArsR/SmtB family transcription factor [Acidimicrobiia bacterium EGI L10123]
MEAHPTEVCCQPVTASLLAEDEAEELAGLLKVLADPARLRLLSLVATAEAGEACACDLVEPLGRSQPTVSHHLSLLVEAGLLSREKRGRWAWYRVVPERLSAIQDALAPGAAVSSSPRP